MSEPVSNPQVEDVLASIRKLVSQDDRPARQPEFGGPKSVDPEADKLVLAPSFRVNNDEAADEGAAEAALDAAFAPEAKKADDKSRDTQEPPLTPADLDLGTNMDIEDAPADFDDFEQVVVGLKDQAAPSFDDSHLASEKPVPDASFDAPMEQDALVDGGVTTPPESTLNSWNDQVSDGSDDDAINAELAFLRRPLEEEFSADVTEGAREALGFVDQSRPETPDADLQTSQDHETPASLRSKIAALEAVINKGSSVEPARSKPELEPQAPTPADAVEEAPAENAHEAQKAAESAEAEPLVSEMLDSSQDVALDEAILRDLIAEVVREELQGALGERITRNVRKLVRREIHRALTTQELD